MQTLTGILIVLLGYTCLCLGTREAVVLNVNDAEVFREAEFAVEELRKLSESGVYESLSLRRIKEAYYSDGIFHHNTIFTLELSSPHYKSKRQTEEYKVVVMTNKVDGAKSFAIDEFPNMDDDAIEEYWIHMVEGKRKEREEAFRRMEIEYILEVQGPRDSERNLSAMSIEQLLDIVDATTDDKTRRAAADTASTRILGEHKDADERLRAFPSKRLFAIANDSTETHYSRYMAQKLLDERLESAHDSTRTAQPHTNNVLLRQEL